MESSRPVRIPVPRLHGGISRQPASQRHANQVEDAINVSFNIIDGASKRPGSHFIKLVDSLTADGDYRLHAIEREGEGGERYLVLYGEGDLRVFELDGTEATVTATAEADAYLASGSPASTDLKLITIADYTMIVNTKVNTAVAATADYTVTKEHESITEMYAHTPVIDTYHKVNEDAGQPATYWRFQPGGTDTFASRQYAHIQKNESSLPWGSHYTAVDSGFKVGFVRFGTGSVAAADWDDTAKTITKIGAFTDYTFEAGDFINITDGTDINPGWYPVASRDDADTITISDPDDEVGLDASDVEFYGIGSDHLVIIRPVTNSQTFDTMNDVAAAYRVALQATPGGRDATIEWVETANARGYMRITGPYRGDGTEVLPARDPETSNVFDVTQVYAAFGELGNIANASGTLGTGTDGDATPLIADRWIQQSVPNQAGASPTASSLPIQLIRTGYTGDGSTPATFDLQLATWNSRQAGDEDTNPAPSVFTNGEPITDIAYHRTRLVLAAGEFVNFSQADDLFNFYIDNPENLVDSDPIDIQLSGEEVALVEHMVPFQKSLMIFTKAGRQFELNAPDLLTPSTAAITPTTAYRSKPVRPRIMGSLLYFLADRQNFTSLYEYYYDDSRVSNTAADVTAHVAGLIPADVRSLQASTNNQMAFVLADECYTIYVYKLFFSGNQKEQSAWTKWEFDTDYKIKDIAVIRNELYMLVESGSIFTIEKMAVEQQVI